MDGPTDDEVRRVKIEKRTSQIDLLDSVASKAKVLNQYAATCGDPLAFRTELANVFAITSDDVKRVAQRYLGPGRIELTIHPGDRATSEWAAEVEPVVSEHEVVDSGRAESSKCLTARSCPTSARLPFLFRPVSNGGDWPTVSIYSFPRGTSYPK